jgi:hypothetical protein
MKTLIGLAAKARSGKDTVATFMLKNPNITAYAFADPVKVGCQALFGLTHSEVWCDDSKENVIDHWQRSARQFFQLIGTGWMREYDQDHWLKRAERAFSDSIPNSGKCHSADLKDPKAPFKLGAQAIFGLNTTQTWDLNSADTKDEFWNLSPNEMFDILEKFALETYPNYFELRSQRPLSLPTTGVPKIESEIAIVKDIRYENEADFIRENGGQIWHILRDDREVVNVHCSELGISVKEGDVTIHNNGTLKELAVAVNQQCQEHLPSSESNSYDLG